MMIPIIEGIKKEREPLEVKNRMGETFLLTDYGKYACPIYCGVEHNHFIHPPCVGDTCHMNMYSIND